MPGTTDTVKAKLTPGEFVIRKEAVDMIGVPMLNKLNNMPEEGGHSAIDRIIDMATMSNMKMMYGGGMVKPNYAGGGMVQQYGHGGEVALGYENGGKVQELMEALQQEQQYTMSAPDYGTNIFGQKITEPYEFNPEDFTPMGTVGSIGKGIKQLIKSASTKRTLKNMAKQDDLAKYSFPDASGETMELSGKEIGSVLSILNGRYPRGTIVNYPKVGNRPAYKATVSPSGRFTPLEDSLMGMQYGGSTKEKKMMGYQDGGPVGESDSVEEGIPLPPQPKDPLQIDARQADPSMYEGSQLGVRDQAMMLQDSIEQDTVNKARKTLQLLKLKSLLEGAESLDSETGNPVLDREKDAGKEMTRQMLQRMIMMRGMPF